VVEEVAPMNWLAHVLGLTNLSGPFYGFWSGFGSDLGEVTIIGLGFGAFRHVNCHAKRCWRIGRHPVEGTPFKECSRHHLLPDAGQLVEHILAACAIAHEAALERTPA
jgi:hypothetical protein